MELFGFGKRMEEETKTEVPVMLALCWFANKTKGWFK